MATKEVHKLEIDIDVKGAKKSEKDLEKVIKSQSKVKQKAMTDEQKLNRKLAKKNQNIMGVNDMKTVGRKEQHARNKNNRNGKLFRNDKLRFGAEKNFAFKNKGHAKANNKLAKHLDRMSNIHDTYNASRNKSIMKTQNNPALSMLSQQAEYESLFNSSKINRNELKGELLEKHGSDWKLKAAKMAQNRNMPQSLAAKSSDQGYASMFENLLDEKDSKETKALVQSRIKDWHKKNLIKKNIQDSRSRKASKDAKESELLVAKQNKEKYKESIEDWHKKGLIKKNIQDSRNRKASKDAKAADLLAKKQEKAAKAAEVFAKAVAQSSEYIIKKNSEFKGVGNVRNFASRAGRDHNESVAEWKHRLQARNAGKNKHINSPSKSKLTEPDNSYQAMFKNLLAEQSYEQNNIKNKVRSRIQQLKAEKKAIDLARKAAAENQAAQKAAYELAKQQKKFIEHNKQQAVIKARVMANLKANRVVSSARSSAIGVNENNARVQASIDDWHKKNLIKRRIEESRARQIIKKQKAEEFAQSKIRPSAAQARYNKKRSDAIFDMSRPGWKQRDTRTASGKVFDSAKKLGGALGKVGGMFGKISRVALLARASLQLMLAPLMGLGRAMGGTLSFAFRKTFENLQMASTSQTNMLKAQGFKSTLDASGIKSFNNAATWNSSISGDTTSQSQAGMAGVLGQLRAGGSDIKPGDFMKVAQTIRGVSLSSGTSGDDASQKLIGLLTGRISMSEAGLYGAKKGNNAGETLDNIYKFLKTNPTLSGLLDKRTMSSDLNAIQNAPQQGMDNMISKYPLFLEKFLSRISGWITDFFSGSGVTDAWASAMESVQTFMDILVGKGYTGSSVSIGLAELLGGFISTMNKDVVQKLPEFSNAFSSITKSVVTFSEVVEGIVEKLGWILNINRTPEKDMNKRVLEDSAYLPTGTRFGGYGDAEKTWNKTDSATNAYSKNKISTGGYGGGVVIHNTGTIYMNDSKTDMVNGTH